MQEPTALSFLQAVRELLAELPALFSDRVKLLALELTRARRALGQIIGLALAAAIFMATAWAALWVGLGVLMLRLGVPLGYMLLAVLLLNLAGVLVSLLSIRRLARWLTLPGTVRRLTLPTTTSTASAPAPAPATPHQEPRP